MKCKNPKCNYEVPDRPLFHANIVAAKHGYCDWPCFAKCEGREVATEALVKEKRECIHVPRKEKAIDGSDKIVCIKCRKELKDDEKTATNTIT